MSKRSLATVILLSLSALLVAAVWRPVPPLRASPPDTAPAELRVAAAADLQKAFREIGPLFEKETGAKVTFVFGSTGLLAKQAENGAPFDLFAAANESYLLDLERKGRILSGSRRLYAIGRLVLWTRKERACPKGLTDLTKDAYRRIALANPRHAPYGAAAREALQKIGLWKAVEPKLIYGENVQQTLQYAQTGNADAALVALSLAVGSEGRYLLIPDRLHSPLRQSLGILASTRQESLAKRFAAFVNGPQGRPRMRRYGFRLPPDA